MLTLSKGFKKPQNTDTSDVWMPAMEQNIQKLNDHKHDGSDSQLLGLTAQTLLAANWGDSIEGTYAQSVTLPAGFNYDTCSMDFKLSTGEVIYPSIDRVSTTQYIIYTNDNTLTYTANYR